MNPCTDPWLHEIELVGPAHSHQKLSKYLADESDIANSRKTALNQIKLLPGSRQRGLALVSLMVAILILAVLAALGASKISQQVNDVAAESTGAYLLHIKGVVGNSLATHRHAYHDIDTSTAPPGTYPVAPSWINFSAGERLTVSVEHLKDSNLLRDDFPDTPPFGRSAHIQFVRSGTCPGDDCDVQAYIYTCWPISTARPSVTDLNDCPSAPEALEHDPALVAAVVMATDGYGGSNSIDPSRVHGALFSFDTTDLGLPANSPGHAVVLASLNSTMFNQFVRQGDDRPIHLANNLTVDGLIQTNTGLVMNTAVIAGASCDHDEMYATTSGGALAMCTEGTWVPLINSVVMSAISVEDGATAPAPVCPSGMTSFFAASLQTLDTVVSGSDIEIPGTFEGEIDGSGTVSSSGTVSVGGTFSGAFLSGSESHIRVGQRVQVNSSGLVTIDPPGLNARALVMSGCRI